LGLLNPANPLFKPLLQPDVKAIPANAITQASRDVVVRMMASFLRWWEANGIGVRTTRWTIPLPGNK
jgi:hypothetical protein